MPQASYIIICQARIRTVHYHVRERNIPLIKAGFSLATSRRLAFFVFRCKVSHQTTSTRPMPTKKRSLFAPKNSLVQNQLFSHDDGLVGKYIRILKQIGQNVENHSCQCNEIHIVVERKRITKIS